MVLRDYTDDRDEQTRRVLLRSPAWIAIVARATHIGLVKAGAIDLSLLSEGEHLDIRLWCERGGDYRDAPEPLRKYFERF